MNLDRESQRRILVVTAVMAERDAVSRGIKSDNRYNLLVGGVGPVSAAVQTASALATAEYGLVVCAGIGGGFKDRVGIGSIAVASEIIAVDLGVETPQGFRSVDEMGFGYSRIQVDVGQANHVFAALQARGLPVHLGPVLTVSTATGTDETAIERAVRVPGALAEAMEGYGAAAAALNSGVPMLEIRAISNTVGLRDRAAWRIPDALKILEEAFSILQEVL